MATWWGRFLAAQWSAEIYVDPALAERLQDALPADVVSEHRALADLYRRPYPLQVQLPDSWWSRSNCGAAFDEGEAEGLNLCVKKVKRCGHGFQPFEHYRLRVLLHAGGVNLAEPVSTATHPNPCSPLERVERLCRPCRSPE